MHTVRSAVLTPNNDQQEKDNDFAKPIKNEIIACKPVGVAETPLPLHLSVQSACSETSALKVFEMKCPHLKFKLMLFILTHVLSTAIAETLPFMFKRTGSGWLDVEFHLETMLVSLTT